MNINNPWHQISTEMYEKHMGHEAVQQLQMLSRVTDEQLQLVRDMILPAVAILGITNGNGLEHVSKELFRTVIAMDINHEFIDVCQQRYGYLEPVLKLHQIDLISDREKAISLLTPADLVIANLLIEHIHLDNFLAIVMELPKARVSVTIQVNPDGSLTSHSGYEHAFDKVVELVRECDETDIVGGMAGIGYHLFGNTEYDLPNGKRFVRLDFSKT